MSLLHQEELDDAARGEELTKGTSHVLIAAVIAAIVVTIIIAVYVIAGQKPPAITGEIEQVWVHPMHTVTSGFDASGAPIPQETLDQVLVITRIKLHNQSQIPLFVLNILTNATLSDGIHSSYAATSTQYEELFMMHPELAALHGPALSPQTTIEPGGDAEGNIVSAYRMTKQEWDAHTNLNYSVTVRYQPNLVLTPKVPETLVP
jgi:hypothetical protein